MDEREALATATKQYQRTQKAHERARDEVVRAVAAALRAGIGPTEVATLSPFTSTYVRRLAREHGIPPAR